MIASARDQDKLHRVTEGLGMQAAANNAAVCRAADLLVVAVKPAMISDVLLPLQEELKNKPLLSIAAGWTTKQYQELWEQRRAVFV